MGWGLQIWIYHYLVCVSRGSQPWSLAGLNKNSLLFVPSIKDSEISIDKIKKTLSLPHVPNFQIFLWGFWGQVMKCRRIHSSDCHTVKVTNIWSEYSALINVNLVIAAFLLFQTLVLSTNMSHIFFFFYCLITDTMVTLKSPRVESIAVDNRIYTWKYTIAVNTWKVNLFLWKMCLKL